MNKLIKPEKNSREERYTTEIRLHSEPDQKRPIITGYAAVYGRRSGLLPFGFYEIVEPGAFTKTIKEKDLRAIFNHDSKFVLGRTSNGTLRIKDDSVGLGYEIDPPRTQWADDLIVQIERRDITGSSFGFRTIRDRWEETDDGIPVRYLVEVELFEFGPTAFPAYEPTTAAIRSLFGVDPVRFSQAITRIEAGLAEPDDINFLADYRDRINSRIPNGIQEPENEPDQDAPGKGSHAAGTEDVSVPSWNGFRYRSEFDRLRKG